MQNEKNDKGSYSVFSNCFKKKNGLRSIERVISFLEKRNC